MLCLVTQSCLTLCTPWTVAFQVPLSMGILQPRILEWLPCPPSEDLTNPRFEHRSPTLQADSLPFESPGKLHRDTLEKLFVQIKETICILPEMEDVLCCA